MKILAVVGNGRQNQTIGTLGDRALEGATAPSGATPNHTRPTRARR